MNWDQLKTILWLRWRLARNQMMRGKGIGAVIAAIIAVAACLIGVVSFVVALLCGIYTLDTAKPIVLWSVWCGTTLAFLFVWTIGLLQELQRSETIDLQRLMHLPVALGQMFVINYIASLFALSIVIFVPAMMGLTLGLIISRGLAMLLLAPLVLGLIFTVTAWTYCLRGWLASLMSNPRRRRNVMMIIVATFILLAQAPNLYFNVFHRIDSLPAGASPEQKKRWSDERKADGQNQLNRVLSFQKFIPPLWLAAGAKDLAEGRAWPAVVGALGFCAIGALGVRRAYLGTLRFYRGETGGKSGARAETIRKPALVPAIPAKVGSHFLELRFPGVPEQSAALALATFQSMLRAPEVKIAWGSSFLVPLLVGGSLLFRSSLKVPEAGKPFIHGRSGFFDFHAGPIFRQSIRIRSRRLSGLGSFARRPQTNTLGQKPRLPARRPGGRNAAAGLEFGLFAPFAAGVPGRRPPIGRVALARGHGRQLVFHSRAFSHPTRIDETDQNAWSGHRDDPDLPNAFSAGDGARVRAAAGGVFVAARRIVAHRSREFDSFRHARGGAGADLLADSHPARPPATPPRNPHPRYRHGGGGIESMLTISVGGFR